MSSHQLPNKQAVILTTTRLEYQAVRDQLSNLQEKIHKGTIYEEGHLQTPKHIWLVGITQVGSGNNAAAAAEAERAITYFQPSVVLHVGIARGLTGVQIGDVIAANKVYSYESGKASTLFEPLPEIGKPTHALEQRAMAEAKKDDWRQRIKAYTHEYIPQVHVGPMAAGEKVIASLHSETIHLLRENYGDTLAIEMEGYGFLRAMYANKHIDTLIIRGIASIITEKPKNENTIYQIQAAQHASAFAMEILAKFQTDDNVLLTKPLEKKEVVTNKIRVLAIFANPIGTGRLHLDVEERTIRNAINRSKHNENIFLQTLPAATFSDLSREMLNENFQIVHIASHGNQQGIVLANDQGGRKQVDLKTLQNLFQEYHATIQCLILNTCHSLLQGSLISQHIPYTIAIDDALDDQVAIEFSDGFYDAIAAGKDIEHAYREGNRRITNAFPNTLLRPLLIKKGEQPPEPLEFHDQETDGEVSEPLYIENIRVLFGIALDLSASMKKSFLNQSDSETKRLTSIQKAFKELVQSAHQGIQDGSTDDTATEIDMFIYAFGLQAMNICDLLSLWKASQQILTNELVNAKVQQYKQERQGITDTYQGLGKLIRTLGARNTADLAERIAQQAGRQKIRKRIWHDMQESIESRAVAIGDTTLALDDIIQWWKESEELLDNAEDILFGKTTPMTDVLTKIVTRFQRELKIREEKTQPILFIISDGKFTTSSPLHLAEKLKAMGITILCCLITGKDEVDSRQLRNQPLTEWSDEARLMFKMASPLKENTPVETFLLSKGWTIYPQSKLFVQANHSDVLKEFTRITLGHLEVPNSDTQSHG